MLDRNNFQDNDHNLMNESGWQKIVKVILGLGDQPPNSVERIEI